MSIIALQILEMSQTKQILQATLDIPREFWRGHAPEKSLESAAQQHSAFVPIRSLNARHRKAILGHLLALNEQDRYLRFGYFASDEMLQRYVADLDFNRDEIYGIFNRRLKLIAMAHLAFSSDPKCASCAEFGVSVLPDARGKGLGTLLFERALLHAQTENIDMLFIHALSENAPMLKIARKAGAVAENYGGETELHLRLPAQDFAQQVELKIKDAVTDTLGEVDFNLKQKALQFWQLLASMQEVRQGVREGRHQSAE